MQISKPLHTVLDAGEKTTVRNTKPLNKKRGSCWRSRTHMNWIFKSAMMQECKSQEQESHQQKKKPKREKRNNKRNNAKQQLKNSDTEYLMRAESLWEFSISAITERRVMYAVLKYHIDDACIQECMVKAINAYNDNDYIEQMRYMKECYEHMKAYDYDSEHMKACFKYLEYYPLVGVLAANEVLV